MGPRTTICSVTSDSEASHPRPEELHRSRSPSTSTPTVSSTCPPRIRPPESLRRSLSPTTLADSPKKKSKRWSRTPRNTRTKTTSLEEGRRQERPRVLRLPDEEHIERREPQGQVLRRG